MISRTSVTVVTVNYKTPLLAMTCINALFSSKVRNVDLRCVLVDGYSNDGRHEDLLKFCQNHPSGAVELLQLSQNGGFGWANNQALMRLVFEDSAPEFVYLLNPDAVLADDALQRLVSLMLEKPDCGAAGSLLFNDEGRRLGSAFTFPTLRSEFVRGSNAGRLGRWLRVGDGFVSSDVATEADWVTGASVLLRTAALRQCGLFDDGFFLYFEDVELMWRMRRRGWSVWHEPASRVVHAGGAATGVTGSKWSGQLPARPAYWYRARKRYFTLTRGVAAAAAADVCWVGGFLLGLLGPLLRRGEPPVKVRNEARDMLQGGLLPSRFDAIASVPFSSAHVGRDPFWRTHED